MVWQVAHLSDPVHNNIITSIQRLPEVIGASSGGDAAQAGASMAQAR